MTDTCSGRSLLSLSHSTRSRRRRRSYHHDDVPCGGRPDGRNRSVLGSTAMNRSVATCRRLTGYAHTVCGAGVPPFRLALCSPVPSLQGISRTRPWSRACFAVLLPTTEKTRSAVTHYTSSTVLTRRV